IGSCAQTMDGAAIRTNSTQRTMARPCPVRAAMPVVMGWSYRRSPSRLCQQASSRGTACSGDIDRGSAAMRPGLVPWALSGGAAVSVGFARFGYALILPAMQTDLHLNYAEAGWLNTANSLGYLLGALLT